MPKRWRSTSVCWSNILTTRLPYSARQRCTANWNSLNPPSRFTDDSLLPRRRTRSPFPALLDLYRQANRTDDLLAYLKAMAQRHGARFLPFLASEMIQAGKGEEAVALVPRDVAARAE
jgi:nucleotide-binding universal stress UspA family protein